MNYLIFVYEGEAWEGWGCDLNVVEDSVFEVIGNDLYRYMSPGSFDLVKIRGETYLTAWKLVGVYDEVIKEIFPNKEDKSLKIWILPPFFWDQGLVGRLTTSSVESVN